MKPRHLIATVLVVMVLYPLSEGPVIALFGGLPESPIIDWIYFPVERLAQHNSWLAGFLARYDAWWLEHAAF
jgi:hypothetical protein